MKKIRLSYQEALMPHGDAPVFYVYNIKTPRMFLARLSTDSRAYMLSDIEHCKDLHVTNTKEILTEDDALWYTSPFNLGIGLYIYDKFTNKVETKVSETQRFINLFEDNVGWKRSEFLQVDVEHFVQVLHVQGILEKGVVGKNINLYVLKTNPNWFRLVPIYHTLIVLMRIPHFLNGLPKKLTIKTIEELAKNIELGNKNSVQYRDFYVFKYRLSLIFALLTNFKELIKGNTLKTHWENWDLKFGIYALSSDKVFFDLGNKDELKMYNLLKEYGYDVGQIQ